LFECELIPCNYTSVAYIGVEFARDVEMQTDETNTTQESAAKYLHNQQCVRDPFICVVNTGLHDLILTMDRNGVTYSENVAWYLGLLQPCCNHLIWISMSATLDDKRFPQKNSVIELWNTKVQTLLQDEQYNKWTTVVDSYKVSMTWPHEGNVHLNKEYYYELGKLFRTLMFSGEAEF